MRAWNTSKPDMCCTLTSSSTFMKESNEREHWELTCKTRVFTHFLSIENVMLCLPKHVFARFHLVLSLKSVCQWYFSISFNKKGTFKDQKTISSASRPWNQTPEIQGFSRCVQTLKTYGCKLKMNVFISYLPVSYWVRICTKNISFLQWVLLGMAALLLSLQHHSNETPKQAIQDR